MSEFEEIDALVAGYSTSEAEGLLPWKPHYYRRWLIVKGLVRDESVVDEPVPVDEPVVDPVSTQVAKPRSRKRV